MGKGELDGLDSGVGEGEKEVESREAEEKEAEDEEAEGQGEEDSTGAEKLGPGLVPKAD